ncbi:His-Xaa-Ser system protein HxsD [Chitinophaga sp. W3I9]|uniref:His-Xaa-Ser system protein HxsD n=1 Tax=unclassified Chitinophaga TaxID=2619133 RepID=UPI003D217EDE
MKFLQDNNTLSFTVATELYPEVVLFKCLYWYTNAFEVDIIKTDPLQYKIILTRLYNAEPVDWKTIIVKLKQDLIDFKLRQCITDETKTIRELIIAKAFAYYENETIPMSEISDPVGFSPQSIQP